MGFVIKHVALGSGLSHQFQVRGAVRVDSVQIYHDRIIVTVECDEDLPEFMMIVTRENTDDHSPEWTRFSLEDGRDIIVSGPYPS